MSTIKTDAKVERPSVAVWLNKEVGEVLHKPQPKDEREQYDIKADAIATIAESCVNGLIAKKADRINPERTQVEMQFVVENKIVY